jgi:O-antigen/teichoic acid export membrane protein
MNKFKRNVGYIFWSFAEQASVIAMPRLVFWPIAAYLLGKESFGIFIFAFSITSILGMQPGNGLATGLLRHLSDFDKEKQRQFCGIAMRLCHKAMLVIVAMGLLSFVVLGSTDLVSRRVIYCLIPLTISLYPENQTHLLLTESRFHRKFKQRAVWFAVRSIINIIGGVIGAKAAGLIGLVWGFVIGNMIVYVILRVRYQEWFDTSYDTSMAVVLKKIWLHITIAGIIAFAGPYLNRIVLGSVHGFNDMADLVAATGVSYIFLAPIACVGALLLSIISRYNSIHDLSRDARIQWLFMFVFGVAICPIGLRLFAPSILKMLYPGFGEESSGLLQILIWLVVTETVVNLCRPFVMKFSSVKLVPIINGINLIATLVPALCLIPIYRSTGAAWAIVIGSGITGCLWLVAAGYIYYRPMESADRSVITLES